VDEAQGVRFGSIRQLKGTFRAKTRADGPSGQALGAVPAIDVSLVPQIEVGTHPEHVQYPRGVASQERAQNRAVLNPNFPRHSSNHQRTACPRDSYRCLPRTLPGPETWTDRI